MQIKIYTKDAEEIMRDTKKKTKNEEGITLIALIITIIVLLILAAVTIITLTGENGILRKSRHNKRRDK